MFSYKRSLLKLTFVAKERVKKKISYGLYINFPKKSLKKEIIIILQL